MTDPRDQRIRTRVRIEIPVRIRQLGPPRDRIDIASTLDASRNGILFLSRERYDVGANVWVTMPYRSEAPAGDLEFPATVVRAQALSNDLTEVALQFLSGRADRTGVTQVASAAPVKSSERRVRNRVRVELPIRVRDLSESQVTVTVDVSRTGVLFRSHRSYAAGEKVWVVVPYQRGGEQVEVQAQIVRTVEKAGQRSVALQYANASATRASTRPF